MASDLEKLLNKAHELVLRGKRSTDDSTAPLEQLLNKARELFTQGKITSEDSAAALRRSREMLALFLPRAIKRKFNRESDWR